jgi:putative endonuclease
MYHTYVLQGKGGKFYKGVTNNLDRRLKEHKLGKTKTTVKMKDLKVVYKEVCDNLKIARKRELYLKSATGRRFLKRILNH